jgi:hypothetical protein
MGEKKTIHNYILKAEGKRLFKRPRTNEEHKSETGGYRQNLKMWNNCICLMIGTGIRLLRPLGSRL